MDDLTLLRRAHLARIATARQIDSRTGEPIGLHHSLIALGCYLATTGVAMPLDPIEQAFGWDRIQYVAFGEVWPSVVDEGEAFAAAILADLRRCGDGVRVRLPGRDAPALRIAA